MSFHRNKIIQFCVSTLNEFNFKTRVILNNKFNEPCYINCIVRNEDGEFLYEEENIGYLDNFKIIEVDKLTKDFNEKNYVVDFSIVPRKYGYKKFVVDANYDEIKKMYGCQDHLVEYCSLNSSFEVLYNIPPNLNNQKFGAKFSTLFQAPKILISKKYSTYILFLNSSSDIDYNKKVNFYGKLYSQNGTFVSKLNGSVLPNGRQLLNIKKKLSKKSFFNDEFYYLEVVSNNGTIIPLTITEKNNNSYTIEHSIPPIGYGNKIFGNRKIDIVKNHLEERKNLE